MATHSSILAWRIPWTEEPGELQSMGSQRVRYDWVTNTHCTITIFTLEFNMREYNNVPNNKSSGAPHLSRMYYAPHTALSALREASHVILIF